MHLSTKIIEISFWCDFCLYLCWMFTDFILFYHIYHCYAFLPPSSSFLYFSGLYSFSGYRNLSCGFHSFMFMISLKSFFFRVSINIYCRSGIIVCTIFSIFYFTRINGAGSANCISCFWYKIYYLWVFLENSLFFSYYVWTKIAIISAKKEN